MEETPEFISLEELGRMVEGQVHPVILSYESEDFPLHGVGTAFVLEHAGELYVVSAQHVLDSQHARTEDFRIILRNTPRAILFDRVAVFQPDYAPHFDLLIMRIAAFQHQTLVSAGLYWVSAMDSIETGQQQDVNIFRVFGYPEAGRSYDYDELTFSAVLEVVNGVLTPSTVPGLTTLKVVGNHPPSFRGMSGSMVIADIDGAWKLAGMLTLAGDSTRLLNFIPADNIIYYLDQLLLCEMSGQLLTDYPGITPDN